MRAAHLHGAGAAFDTLLRLGHWSEDENLELHRLQVPDGFSANLQAVAAAVDPESADAGWSGRRRWGGGTWCTSSGDLAFRSRRGLRGWRVDIHMAVPTLLVPPEGALDTEARLRGTDVDLLERRIPMLPDSLAEACRLTPEIPRPALCLRVRLTPELSLADVEIQASRVRPRGVMEPGLVAGSRPLRRLAELATALRARRRAAGAWERLDSSRLEVAGGRPQPARRSDVDVIDTEIGLLAAEAIGWLCEARGLPAIYERREPAAVPLLPESAKRAQTEDVEAVRSYLFDSRSPHPDQSVRPGVHAGFGLTCHAFGGRPLDSYADLAVQRQLLTLTGFGGSADSVAELEQVLLETWEAREAARLVEQTGRRYWSLRSLEGIGSQTHLQAIVVEQQGPGYLVLLAGHPTGAYVRALGNEVFEAAPGRRLLVRVEQVSARRNLLRLVAPRLA
jgi:exoribonuclease-2